MRVAAKVVVLQDVMPEWPRVLHAEPVAPVVGIASELRRPALGVQLAGVRPEAEVAAAHGVFLPIDVRPNFRRGAVAAVMRAACAIDPIVESPPKAVHPELLVAFEEATEEGLPDIGFAVTIGVLEKENFRRGADKNSVAPRQDARGKLEVLREERGLVVAPISVGVFQPADAATGFALPSRPSG